LLEPVLSTVPLRVAACGAALFVVMDLLVRFGREARRLSGAPADRGSTRALYLAMITVSVATFALAPLLPFARLAAPIGVAAAWTGAALVPLGYGLRLWATLTLGRSYTRALRVREGQQLERGGPYRWMRQEYARSRGALWARPRDGGEGPR
jgi:protein-S-isoprenylcysteine O-methyltransferase Ste14